MEERSAGAVVFSRSYVVPSLPAAEYPAGHWDFPKGNIEAGESPLDTMVREVREETGLKSIRIVDGFEHVIGLSTTTRQQRVHKQVTFLLAEATDPNESVTLSFEHRQFAWRSLDEAMKVVSYQNSRRLLRAAEQVLGYGGGIERLKF